MPETPEPIEVGTDWRKDVPNVELQRSRDRHEVTLLIRSPYLCLRLGTTQCALWYGNLHNVFNLFPAAGLRGLRGGLRDAS